MTCWKLVRCLTPLLYCKEYKGSWCDTQFGRINCLLVCHKMNPSVQGNWGAVLHWVVVYSAKFFFFLLFTHPRSIIQRESLESLLIDCNEANQYSSIVCRCAKYINHENGESSSRSILSRARTSVSTLLTRESVTHAQPILYITYPRFILPNPRYKPCISWDVATTPQSTTSKKRRSRLVGKSRRL